MPRKNPLYCTPAGTQEPLINSIPRTAKEYARGRTHAMFLTTFYIAYSDFFLRGFRPFRAPSVFSTYASIAVSGMHQSPCTRYAPGRSPRLHRRATDRCVSGFVRDGNMPVAMITGAASAVVYSLGVIRESGVIVADTIRV